MEKLSGGLLNEVFRVGATVRRRAIIPMDRSFSETVLEQLGASGYEAAPRFLGHDEEGRQILSFVEGSVRTGVFDDEIEVVMRLVRRFHDLVPGVCHNDLAPRNAVWTADGGVAFIDWDLCAPGRHIEDVAHTCWQFLGLGPERVAAEVAPVLRRALDAYGLGPGDRTILIDEIAAWQQRCADGIDQGAASGLAPLQKLVDGGAVDEIRASRAWVLDHRAELDHALT